MGRNVNAPWADARLTFIKNEIERNPRISLNTLGEMCGISRERIRQLLKKAGIKKTHARTLPYGYCAEGHQILEIRLKLTGNNRSSNRCFTCKPLKPHQWVDKDTGHIKSKKNVLEVTCYVCGKTETYEDEKAIQRKRYDSYRKHPDMKFCSKECLGSVTGKVWGWGNRTAPGKKDPTSKSEIISGPCDSCGKPTSQSRAKKQYMNDPSIGPSYKNKHMFCSRTCMAIFRRKEAIKVLENYIETNTTPVIKRQPNGNWAGNLRIRSIPLYQKDKSGGRTISFVGKTRMEVHEKLMARMRKDLKYRIKELKTSAEKETKATKEKEDKKIHEQSPDWVNSGYVELNSLGVLSSLYGYINKRLPIRRR